MPLEILGKAYKNRMTLKNCHDPRGDGYSDGCAYCDKTRTMARNRVFFGSLHLAL